jgi:hypothetical protein
MTQNNQLAPHEILELKEIMSTEVLGLKKLQTSMEIVNDIELKSFMERCVSSKKDKIGAIQGFIENNQI